MERLNCIKLTPPLSKKGFGGWKPVPLTFRKSAAYFFFLFSLAFLLLTGCGLSLGGPDGGKLTGNAGSAAGPDERQPGAEKDHPVDPEAQAQFEALTDRIFQKAVTSSIIDLHYTVTRPEELALPQPQSAFGEVSVEAFQKDGDFIRESLEELKKISKESLTIQSQLDYDILENYLETEKGCEGLEYYHRILMPTIGVQAQLPILIAEYVFYEEEDIQDYFQLLTGLDDYYGQILAFEQERADQGLMVSDSALDRIIDSCRPYLKSGEENILSGTFSQKLEGLDALTQEEKAEYIQRHEELIANAFIPAYQHLIQGLEQLKGRGAIDGGLYYYPNGKEYYRYLVYSSTATSCKSVDTLAKTILSRIQNDLIEMAQILEEKPELMDQIDEAVSSMTDPSQILDYLQEAIIEEYPEPICQDYSIHYVPEALEESLSPAFFLTPPIDQASANPIYINRGSLSVKNDLFSTLAHEGYPGHLYQSAYFVAQRPALFRHALAFSAYTEGWATYVEYESYRMVSGGNDDIARLLAKNAAVNLGIHAYVDIMVNDQGWKTEEISKFLEKFFYDPDPEFSTALYEAMVDNPSNYLEYYTGYLEFSDMRHQAEHALGDSFSLKDFHQFLLDMGPSPFPVIREKLNLWISEQKAAA